METNLTSAHQPRHLNLIMLFQAGTNFHFLPIQSFQKSNYSPKGEKCILLLYKAYLDICFKKRKKHIQEQSRYRRHQARSPQRSRPCACWLPIRCWRQHSKAVSLPNKRQGLLTQRQYLRILLLSQKSTKNCTQHEFAGRNISTLHSLKATFSAENGWITRGVGDVCLFLKCFNLKTTKSQSL